MLTHADPVLDGFLKSFATHKQLAEGAVAQLSDEMLRRPVGEGGNSIAVIMKHVAGNLRSRWTDLLTSDGEKAWRHRDGEFIDTYSGRSDMMADWEAGWDCVFATLRGMTSADLMRDVTIRGERLSVPVAMTRSLAHTGYHVGQIVLAARMALGDRWQTLSIPPGGSQAFNEQMKKR